MEIFLAKLKNNKLLRLVLWAVLIRLLLIPFFAHPDILKTYRRSFDIAFNQQSPFSHLLSIVPHTIQALMLQISSCLVGRDILNQINFAAADIIYINLLLFIMKLPYLIAEVLFWLVLKNNFSLSDTAWKWLLFNPVILYSVYLFGRYESFVLLLMALFLAAVHHKKIFQGFFWLIGLIFTRFSLVLILPTLVLLEFKQLKKVVLLVVGAGVAGLVAFPEFIGDLAARFAGAFSGSHAGYLFETRLPLPFGFSIPLFVVFLVLLLLAASKIAFARVSFVFKFSLFASLILASYYASSLFHPQYLSWIILPLTLILDKVYWQKKAAVKKNRLLSLNLLLMIFAYFLIIFYWNTDTTLGLLFPVFSGFKFTYFDADLAKTISDIGRILFSANLLFLCIKLISDIYQNLNIFEAEAN